MKKLIFLSIIAGTLVIACSKKAETDTTPPSITITSPTANQMVMSDSVLVEFTVADPDLHSYQYTITDTIVKDTVAAIDETHIPTDGMTSYTFRQKIKVRRPAQLKLEVISQDHTENTNSKSVYFYTML